MNLATMFEQFMPAYDRVRAHTAPHVNARIDAQVRGILDALADKDRDALVRRLSEIEREWDIDRALTANFALLGGTAFLLGLVKSQAWLYFFGAQLGFLLLHAIAGWCPPSVVARRLGVRTQQEIGAERMTLLTRLRMTPATHRELLAQGQPNS
jgi:hypothetical protein